MAIEWQRIPIFLSPFSRETNMASSSITLPTQLKSHFLGGKLLPGKTQNLIFPASKQRSMHYPKASAKFNLFEGLGGRGLGGFPGGETGLRKFIEKNPPPPKKTQPGVPAEDLVGIATSKKVKAPELPLLMPGMIAIVKNPNNPFYMYCGIVQRITDGRAGVLFEGGNWDKLITFRLEELERREKGPPAKNPKSVVLEAIVEKDS